MILTISISKLEIYVCWQNPLLWQLHNILYTRRHSCNKCTRYWFHVASFLSFNSNKKIFILLNLVANQTYPLLDRFLFSFLHLLCSNSTDADIALENIHDILISVDKACSMQWFDADLHSFLAGLLLFRNQNTKEIYNQCPGKSSLFMRVLNFVNINVLFPPKEIRLFTGRTAACIQVGC